MNLHLVNEEKYMAIKLSDMILDNGKSRDGLVEIELEELLSTVNAGKPFEELLMSDLGTFKEITSVLNNPDDDSPAWQIAWFYLIGAEDEARNNSVATIDLGSEKIELVQAILPPYIPEPFKTNVAELGAETDYYCYYGADIERFITNFEQFCTDFKVSKVPPNLDEDERFDLERILDDPEDKKYIDQTLAISLKKLKRKLQAGYKDLLILSYN